MSGLSGRGFKKFSLIAFGLTFSLLGSLLELKNILWVFYMDVFTVTGIVPHAIPSSYVSCEIVALITAIGVVLLSVGLSFNSLFPTNSTNLKELKKE